MQDCASAAFMPTDTTDVFSACSLVMHCITEEEEDLQCLEGGHIDTVPAIFNEYQIIVQAVS